MDFSSFVIMIHEKIFTEKTQVVFLIELIDNVLRDPVTIEEIEEKKDDKYNPLKRLSKNTIAKYYEGGDPFPINTARLIIKRADYEKLSNFFAENLDDDSSDKIAYKLKEAGFSVEDTNVADSLSNAFKSILNYCANTRPKERKMTSNNQKKIKENVETTKEQSAMSTAHNNIFATPERIIYISSLIKGTEGERQNKVISLLNDSADVCDIDNCNEYTVNDFKRGVKYRIKCEHKFEPVYNFDQSFSVNVKIIVNNITLSSKTSPEKWLSKSTMNNMIDLEKYPCYSVFEILGEKCGELTAQFLIIGEQR